MYLRVRCVYSSINAILAPHDWCRPDRTQSVTLTCTFNSTSSWCSNASREVKGHHISSFKLSLFVGNVAFDEHRGLVAVNRGNQVSVLGANQWLPGTFVWQPDRHCYAPAAIKAVVRTITMLRSLSGGTRHADALSLIPNELLFEIFSYL